MLEDKNNNIDLSITSRKKFTIDGDENRILSLDTSDMGVLKRLDKTLPELQKMADKAIEELSSSAGDDSLSSLSQVLSKIDKEMREKVDYIFDADVSRTCAPSGTMYDPYNGRFRFEHILEVISGLYADNITKEFRLMSKRTAKHTSKYTKGKKNV